VACKRTLSLSNEVGPVFLTERVSVTARTVDESKSFSYSSSSSSVTLVDLNRITGFAVETDSAAGVATVGFPEMGVAVGCITVPDDATNGQLSIECAPAQW
jgi:hypothetical protein